LHCRARDARGDGWTPRRRPGELATPSRVTVPSTCAARSTCTPLARVMGTELHRPMFLVMAGAWPTIAARAPNDKKQICDKISIDLARTPIFCGIGGRSCRGPSLARGFGSRPGSRRASSLTRKEKSLSKKVESGDRQPPAEAFAAIPPATFVSGRLRSPPRITKVDLAERILDRGPPSRRRSFVYSGLRHMLIALVVTALVAGAMTIAMRPDLRHGAMVLSRLSAHTQF